MEINAIAGQQTDATRAGATLADDFDNFLNLLTTQLQYQDPLSPLDSNEFTQQLVSFTGVEQSIATNQNLEKLVAQNKTLESANAVDYLGKEITVQSDRAGLGEEGTAVWEYILGTTASSVELQIKDQNGILIETLNGDLSAGVNQFNWTAPTGTEPGVYSLSVVAKSANDEKVDATIYSRGIVTSVEKVGGEVLLASNGILVAPSNVLTVQELKANLPEEDGNTEA